ncbi:MAG: hypothetical protein LBF33_01645 [Oscillospiraceae bacterium]|jgi:hypothetical protein|nr:hypothetical protein [Oscillospiraceae bacterium]
MAKKNEIFRKSSLERISSPEKLNEYIKVSNPGIWMVLVALFVMLAVAVIWSVVVSLPTTITSDGVFSGKTFGDKEITHIRCYLSTDTITGTSADAQKDQMQTGQSAKKTVKEGQKVEILPAGTNYKKDGSITGVVEYVSKTPLAYKDVAEALENEALATQIYPKEGAGYEVLIKMDKSGSSFKWSKGKTPSNFKVISGDSCSVKVFVEEVKPLDFLVN